MTPACALLSPAYSVARTGKRPLSISAVLAIKNPKPTYRSTLGRPCVTGTKGFASRLPPGAVEDDSSLSRSEEHTSELQSPMYLVCRLLLEKKKNTKTKTQTNYT